MARDLGLDTKLLGFFDKEPIQDFGLPSETAAGSRGAFVMRCWSSALSRSHFIYNHVGISRAHCALPFLRRPYAIWIHGEDVWDEGIRAGYGWRIKDATMLLSNTEYTRLRAARLVPSAARAKVCWLATEEDEFPSTRPNFDGPPTVLILARIHATEGLKGHKELIECWPSVVAAVPNARLLIAGGGSGLEAMRALAQASPAANQIEFTGFLSQSEIDALWSRAHVFAMPSRQEGFGLVYIEAMRYGVPVIASKQDAGQEINIDGVTGYNADLDQEGDLAGRIVELLTDRELSRRLGENGREHWRANFCFSAFRRRMEPILAEFVSL